MGCNGVSRGCLWCVFVSDTAQVELRSGRVEAPTLGRPLFHNLVSVRSKQRPGVGAWRTLLASSFNAL